MEIDYQELGKRAAERRRELGLKQYQVCELIDVNYKYISNLETGRSAPSLEVIMKLCKALKTTPNYLLIGTDIYDDTEENISDRFDRLSAENKKIINGMIDLLEKYK